MNSEHIAELKHLVDVLEYTGDDLEFDKALGQIDLLIYQMRQACFPPRGVIAVNLGDPAGLHELLADILGE